MTYLNQASTLLYISLNALTLKTYKPTNVLFITIITAIKIISDFCLLFKKNLFMF